MSTLTLQARSSATDTRSADTREAVDTKRRPALGLGAVLLALPAALAITAALVILGGLPMLWAIPVYGATGAVLTLGLAILPLLRHR